MAATLNKRKLPRPAVGRPLRSPTTAVSRPAPSPVSVVAKLRPVGNSKVPTVKAPLSKGNESPSPPPPKQLGMRKANPPPSPSATPNGGGGGGGGALPVDNMPAISDAPEDASPDAGMTFQQSEEQKAYEEQAGGAEVFTVNNPPVAVVPSPSLWKRIKAWFHDIFAGEEDLSAPLSSAHIANNVLHVASIVLTEDGAHYVVTKVPCPSARGKNGSVNFGAENPGWLVNTIEKARYAIANKAEQAASSRQIEDVVIRARAGDQNAMALISMVRANAQKGNPRAIASYNAFRNFMGKHPAESSMGSELVSTPDKNRANKVQTALVFANGRHLDSEVLRRFGSSFGAESECFFQGARDWNKNLAPHVARAADPYRLQVYEIGQVLGRARALQQMRRPEVPISSYDPQVGWELGE